MIHRRGAAYDGAGGDVVGHTTLRGYDGVVSDLAVPDDADLAGENDAVADL